MNNYAVGANHVIFGAYPAETKQEASDLCAQDAGYESEQDMAEQLGEPSEQIADLVD